MPSLYDETVTDLGEALMSENERLEQELEAAREKLGAVELEKNALVEKVDASAGQLQNVTDLLNAALAAQEERANDAVAKQTELENQLDASQRLVFELSELVQTLRHELRERSAHEQPAATGGKDPRVPHILAEVEALKNQKEALENTLAKASKQLHEAVREKESLKARISSMLDEKYEEESSEGAVAQHRKEAEEYKTQIIVLQERPSSLDKPKVSPQEDSTSAKVNNSQKYRGKDALARYNQKRELKLVDATMLVDANTTTHQPHRTDLSGATLEAFKMCAQSISDYRQQVRSLQDKGDRLETENARLRAPAQPNPRQRLSMAIKDIFEREKKELVTRVRNLQAEVEALTKSVMQQLERNASMPRLEAEVKRLTDLTLLLNQPQRQKHDTAKQEQGAAANSFSVKLEPPTQHAEPLAPAVSLQKVKKEPADL